MLAPTHRYRPSSRIVFYTYLHLFCVDRLAIRLCYILCARSFFSFSWVVTVLAIVTNVVTVFVVINFKFFKTTMCALVFLRAFFH